MANRQEEPNARSDGPKTEAPDDLVVQAVEFAAAAGANKGLRTTVLLAHWSAARSVALAVKTMSEHC
jgi:hypothetical protein